MTTPTTATTNSIYKNTNNFILFVIFILFSTLPLISCESYEKGNDVDASGELRKHLIPSHNIEHSNGEWTLEKAANEEPHPQLFAAYHESFITKTAAQDLRKKIRSHKKPITAQDFNDLLQDIILKPIDDPKNDIYEKKYFDYLPAEEEVDFDSDDDSHDYRFNFDGTANDSELVDELNGYDEFSDEENENSETLIHKTRYKRDIKEDGERLTQNEKRNAVWDQGHHQTVPVTFYISRERQQPINPLIFGTAAYNNLNPNNPRNNRFYGTHLNNFYLPVVPQTAGYIYQRPSIPLSIFIPGQYHNVGEPLQNPQTSTPPNEIFFSRIGIDEEPQPIWGSEDSPQVQVNSISNGFNPKDNTQQPTTRRILPLIHNSDTKHPEIPRPTPKPTQTTQQFNRPDDTQVPTTRRPAPPLMHNSHIKHDEIPRPSPIPPQIPQEFNQQDVRTTTAKTNRPQPSVIQNFESENALDIARQDRIPTNLFESNRQGSNGFIVGPSVGAPIWSSDDGRTQSGRPFLNQKPQQMETPVVESGPSKCVWGIVNCCLRQDINIRYACFERIGCHGAFWDINPCDADILDAAINEADRYFN